MFAPSYAGNATLGDTRRNKFRQIGMYFHLSSFYLNTQHQKQKKSLDFFRIFRMIDCVFPLNCSVLLLACHLRVSQRAFQPFVIGPAPRPKSPAIASWRHQWLALGFAPIIHHRIILNHCPTNTTNKTSQWIFLAVDAVEWRSAPAQLAAKLLKNAVKLCETFSAYNCSLSLPTTT